MKKIIPEGAVIIPDTARRVFKGQIYDVYHWPQKMFDGSDATFEMLKRPDTVTVIPIVGDKIMTIEDEQPYRGVRMTFPGGRIDANEPDTLTAAKREAKEETGYEFDNWKLVRVWQPHTKLEWFIYFYIAWDGQKTSESNPDIGEKISVKLLPFSEAKSFMAAKAGYLGESKEIFDTVDGLEELINLPVYEGMEVDR